MEDSIFFAFVIFVVALVVGLVSNQNVKRVRAQELSEFREAEAAYQSGLAALKDTPTNADLRMEVLLKGRFYYNLKRRRQGIAIDSEIALLNDINAACAGVGAPRSMITSFL